MAVRLEGLNPCHRPPESRGEFCKSEVEADQEDTARRSQPLLVVIQNRP